jgi:hypothetical protein
MRNLNKPKDIVDINELFAVLGNQEISNRISEQIEEAYNQFDGKNFEINSHSDFNKEIARFIQQIYQHGLLTPRLISSTVFFSEALDLLENYYESEGVRGYEAAYLDAVSTYGKGFEFVLRELAEIIKQRELQIYQNWVFSSLIDPTDWSSHKRIICSLIERFKPFLPEDILKGNPARFTKYYKEFIHMVFSTNNLLDRISLLPKISTLTETPL